VLNKEAAKDQADIDPRVEAEVMTFTSPKRTLNIIIISLSDE
jgi:hypothetical protein